LIGEVVMYSGLKVLFVRVSVEGLKIESDKTRRTLASTDLSAKNIVQLEALLKVAVKYAK
jgi:lipid-binding SYLF domain-containing protein